MQWLQVPVSWCIRACYTLKVQGAYIHIVSAYVVEYEYGMYKNMDRVVACGIENGYVPGADRNKVNLFFHVCTCTYPHHII